MLSKKNTILRPVKIDLYSKISQVGQRKIGINISKNKNISIDNHKLNYLEEDYSLTNQKNKISNIRLTKKSTKLKEIKQISINKEKNSNQGITYDNIIKLPAIEKNKNKSFNEDKLLHNNMCKFESDYDLSNSDLSINDQTLNKSDNFIKNLNNRSFYVKSSTNINELNLRKDIKRKLVPDISSKQKVFVKKKLDDIKETIESKISQELDCEIKLKMEKKISKNFNEEWFNKKFNSCFRITNKSSTNGINFLKPKNNDYTIFKRNIMQHYNQEYTTFNKNDLPFYRNIKEQFICLRYLNKKQHKKNSKSVNFSEKFLNGIKSINDIRDQY